MRTHLRRTVRPLTTVVQEGSREARSRVAESVFFGRRARRRDRLISRLHFSLATDVYGGLAADDHHLRCFSTAVDELDGLPDAGLVVDLGTGAGRSAAVLAAHWPQARIEGVDVSSRMVRLARRLHNLPNLHFRRASVTRLPYATGSVDLLTCLNAIVDPAEARRVLATSGCLLMASTWFPLRDEASAWVRRFEESGFRRARSGGVDEGSWEHWRPVAGA